MGQYLSELTIMGISFFMGHYLAQNRDKQYQAYCTILEHKSYKGCRSLVLLISGLYLLSYIVSWVFNFLFSIYDRVPILGSLVVMGTIVWISIILITLMVYCLGSFTWSITSTAFNFLMGPQEIVKTSSSERSLIKRKRSKLKI